MSESVLMRAQPPTAPGRRLPPFFKHLLCQSTDRPDLRQVLRQRSNLAAIKNSKNGNAHIVAMR
jgi:hypothetical protein